MKIRKYYVLYVNNMNQTAFYGNARFNARISAATFGVIYDCTLTELKHDIRILRDLNYYVTNRKY